MAYATKTKVNVEKTRFEIETLLRKNGATRIATMVEDTAAMIIFEMKDRRIKFTTKLPAGEQQRRARWRSLLLCIKAKLESVASGIETCDEVFLAHVVMEDGRTVYEHASPRLDQIGKGGELTPLLPGPAS